MNINILKTKVNNLATQFRDSSSSEHWGDKIDKEKLSNAKKSHKIKNNDYIFYLFDLTFWGSANNSIICTEKGMSLKIKDELPALFLAWETIDYIFLPDETELCLLSEGKMYGVKVEWKISKCFSLLEELVAENASPLQESLKLLMEAHSNWGSVDDIDAVLNLCDRILNVSLSQIEVSYNNLEGIVIGTTKDEFALADGSRCYVRNIRAQFSIKAGKETGARSDLVSYIERCCDTGYFRDPLGYCGACLLLGDICLSSQDYDDAIVFLSLGVSADVDADSVDLQRGLMDKLKIANDAKKNSIATLPRENRQIILCVDEVPTKPVKEFRFVSHSTLKSIDWKFEMGHPQVGEMYISHPLRPDVYYELQSFHDRLFDEKREELVYLLESLGARQLHVETMTGSSEESQKAENTAANGSVSFVVNSSSTDCKTETRESTKHHKLQIGIEDRELNPSDNPHIPEDLVWFPHETSWQRIASSALANRYKSLSVELRYHEDYSINQKRISTIQQALSLFTSKIDIGWNTEAENQLRKRKSTVWKYTATFSAEGTPPQLTSTAPLTDAEQEYLDDLNAALCDGIIDESGKKILERRRLKLGITEQRAAQLNEGGQKISLTEEEKEYMQDFEDCFDDEVITDSEKRLLDRRREKLGISEQRSLELEQLVKSKQ